MKVNKEKVLDAVKEKDILSDSKVEVKDVDTSKIKDRDILIPLSLPVLLTCGLSMLVVVLLGIFLQSSPINIITGAIMTPVLTYCAIIDYKKHLVANVCCIIVSIIGFIPFIYNLISGNYYLLLDAALGAVLVPLPLFIAAMITKGGFGGGDIKMMFGIGLCVGLFKGFAMLVLALFLSVVFMLITNAIKNHKAKKANIPTEKLKNVAFPFIQYIAAAFVILLFVNI